MLKLKIEILSRTSLICLLVLTSPNAVCRPGAVLVTVLSDQVPLMEPCTSGTTLTEVQLQLHS